MSNLTNAITVAILAVVALAVLSALMGSGGDWLKSIRPKPLMTSNEIAFFKLLKAVSAPLHVCPQVAMGAILQVAKGGDRKQRHATRNRFAQKMIDFVLIDDDGLVKLIVELDDRTHDATKDSNRDAMTVRAGYQTLRVRGSDTRNRDSLRARIAESLGSGEDDPGSGARVAQFRPV